MSRTSSRVRGVEVLAGVAQDRLGHPAHRVERRAQLVGQAVRGSGRSRCAVARRSAACSCSSATSAVTPRLASDSSASRARQRRERGGQLGVLLAQLLEPGVDAAGLVVLQRAQDEGELVVVRDPGVVVEVARQARPGRRRPRRDRRAARGPRGRRTAFPAPRTVTTTTAGSSSATARSASASAAVALRDARDLPDGGGQPALRLGAELEQAGQVARAAPREEHVLDRAEGQRDHGRGHGSINASGSVPAFIRSVERRSALIPSGGVMSRARRSGIVLAVRQTRGGTPNGREVNGGVRRELRRGSTGGAPLSPFTAAGRADGGRRRRQPALPSQPRARRRGRGRRCT